MNRVVQFDKRTMDGEKVLERLLVEFDERGHTLREIGIGKDDQIIHRFPGTPTLDEYGVMQPNVIGLVGENPSRGAILMDASDLVSMEYFEEFWTSE